MARERPVCASPDGISNGTLFPSEREETMTSAYALNTADIVGLLVLLVVFVFVPMVFVLCCSTGAHRIKPSLRVCPHCGAQNHTAKECCYCCGHGFLPPGPDAATPTVIQRVRQADRDGTGQPKTTHSAPAAKVRPA